MPVDPDGGFYIPDEVLGTTVFVDASGIVRKGRRSADGLEGYLLHRCPAKLRKEEK